MRTRILSKLEYPVLDIEIVKQHTRVDDDLDTDLLKAYISAAISVAEKHTNRMLVPTIVDGHWPTYLAKVYLPFGHTQEPTSLTATDKYGVSEDVAFTYNSVDESVNVSVDYVNHIDFTIQFDCGYRSGEVPKGLQQGLLLLVGTLYNVREDVSYGVNAYAVPLASKMLFNKFKIHAIGNV